MLRPTPKVRRAVWLTVAYGPLVLLALLAIKLVVNARSYDGFAYVILFTAALAGAFVWYCVGERLAKRVTRALFGRA